MVYDPNSKIHRLSKQVQKDEIEIATQSGGKIKKIYNFLDNLIIDAQNTSNLAEAKQILVKICKFNRKLVELLVKELR